MLRTFLALGIFLALTTAAFAGRVSIRRTATGSLERTSEWTGSAASFRAVSEHRDGKLVSWRRETVAKGGRVVIVRGRRADGTTYSGARAGFLGGAAQPKPAVPPSGDGVVLKRATSVSQAVGGE